jgi:hypothetical protein
MICAVSQRIINVGAIGWAMSGKTPFMQTLIGHKYEPSKEITTYYDMPVPDIKNERVIIHDYPEITNFEYAYCHGFYNHFRRNHIILYFLDIIEYSFGGPRKVRDFADLISGIQRTYRICEFKPRPIYLINNYNPHNLKHIEICSEVYNYATAHNDYVDMQRISSNTFELLNKTLANYNFDIQIGNIYRQMADISGQLGYFTPRSKLRKQASGTIEQICGEFCKPMLKKYESDIL